MARSAAAAEVAWQFNGRPYLEGPRGTIESRLKAAGCMCCPSAAQPASLQRSRGRGRPSPRAVPRLMRRQQHPWPGDHTRPVPAKIALKCAIVACCRAGPRRRTCPPGEVLIHADGFWRRAAGQPGYRGHGRAGPDVPSGWAEVALHAEPQLDAVPNHRSFVQTARLHWCLTGPRR
jgi:hypothetical protein